MSKSNKFSVDELLKSKTEPVVNISQRNNVPIDQLNSVHNYNLMRIYYQKLMENQFTQANQAENNWNCVNKKLDTLSHDNKILEYYLNANQSTDNRKTNSAKRDSMEDDRPEQVIKNDDNSDELESIYEDDDYEDGQEGENSYIEEQDYSDNPELGGRKLFKINDGMCSIMSKKRKRRILFTKHQTFELEKRFRQQRYLSGNYLKTILVF